jgi:hypothetical protein
VDELALSPGIGFHGIAIAQKDADFAIPFLDEDIALYIDPFLLWKSPALQDQSLHTAVVNSFNHLGVLTVSGRQEEAVGILTRASECPEIGLGHSKSRQGHRIGEATAQNILRLFLAHPLARVRGFVHFEEIQFYVEGIGPDRISDITATFVKSFLIDYTIDQCSKLGISGHRVGTQCARERAGVQKLSGGAAVLGLT